MHLSRRKFIVTASASGAYLALANFGDCLAQKRNRNDFLELPPEAYSDPLFSLSARQFEEMVGKTFIATDPTGNVLEIELVEVTSAALPNNTLRGDYGECFSLVFNGPKETVLTQDTFEMRSDGLIAFSALLVPIGRRRRQYEAIVNRLAY